MLKQIFVLILLLCCSISFLSDAILKSNIAESEYIIIAEVISVGSSSGYWSGLIEARQAVEYKVLQVLKGNLDENIVSVDYTLVRNGRNVDKKIPQLSTEIFKPGNRQILFLEKIKHQDNGRGEYIPALQHSTLYHCINSSNGAFLIYSIDSNNPALIDSNKLDHIKDLIEKIKLDSH